MRKLTTFALALMTGMMMLVSCNKDKESKEAVFTATLEQHTGQQGRTAIDPENGDVKWVAGDKILIANGNGETAQFTLQSGAGTTEGTFRTTGEFEMDAPFTAAYPQTAILNGTTATFSLPATQTLTQTGTFANGANPMAAYASDDNLYFRNLCGALDIRLLGDNVHVNGIRITGAEGEMLNGTFTVDCSANEPAIMANQGSNGTNIVTLNCDVTLTSTTTAQEFFIVLPVGALAQGFTMDVLDGENVVCTKQLETNLAQIMCNEVKRFNPLLIGETPTPIELPDVVTNAVTDITTTTATAGGEILSDGGSVITECGVCWSTEQEPTIDGDHIASQVTMGEFTVTVAGLTQNTTYYLRAYATNEAGTSYGDVVTFTTVEEIVITVPTVTTSEVTDITTTTATVGGTITDAGNGTIEESGICYKTGDEEWTCISIAAENNAFSIALTDLIPNTTYTVRAFATNEEGTDYGDEVSFTTLNEGGGDTHEYVDLGLPSGLLWATCNVGADAPEDYGDYFAWGETQPKDFYDWSTYQHCNGTENTLTKYCNNSSYGYNGFTDNLTTLLPEDDAATANWGSDWRMPTKEEWQELINNTTVTWTQQNGVNGRLFTASNGNSLFLPAAGLRYSGSLDYAGSSGCYWSSSLNTDIPYYACYFYFRSVSCNMSYGGYRIYGRSVRPVRSASQN